MSRAEVAQVKEADEALGELTGKAWQSTHTEDINRRRAARAAEAREKLYNKPLATLDDWKALSPSERESIIDSIDYREQASLTYVTNQPIGDITDPQIKAFVDEMRDYMEDNGNMEVEDDNYALIGPVDIEVSVATLPTGEVVGGMIRFHQPGAMNDDNETGYFDTAAEAEAAGFDTDADVSWDAFGYFDVDGEPIRTDDYMEWSGH